MVSPPDTSKTTKLERYNSYLRKVNSTKIVTSTSKILFRTTLLTVVVVILFFSINHPSLSIASTRRPRSLLSAPSFGAPHGRSRSGNPPLREVPLGSPFSSRRRWLCRLALLSCVEETRRWCSWPRQLQLLLRSLVEEIKTAASAQKWDLHRRRRHQQLRSLEETLRQGPVHSHPPPRRPSRRPLRHEEPQSYIHSNIAGFVNLLEVAAKHADPQPAIVWASSSSVYGLNTANPFSESHRTDRPASLYAATKKAGEEIAHTYNHIYGLSLTGLRFFTVYGPWGRPDMAYFFFTKDILDGKTITVFRSAEGQKDVARDFTYIDDVVKGCLGALDTAEKSTGVPGGGKKRGPAQLRVYNLGNTSPVPVSKLVSKLENLLSSKAKKNIVRMPANGDVPYTHANVSLAQHDFGYKPTTDLTSGLRKFVKWYVGYYGIQLKSQTSGGIKDV